MNNKLLVVNVATTSNILLSGIQTIDDVLLNTNDIVLVKNQTDSIKNGIYIVKVGAWKRSPNLQKGSNASGFTVFVKSGTVGINTIYVCVNDIQDDTVGTDPLVFSSVKVSENPLHQIHHVHSKSLNK